MWPESAHGYVTAAEPPVRGEIKAEPEDFLVEEVPIYPPTGVGTHVFFLLEKRGIATFEAIRRLARALGRREEEFGYAGLKDARALTRQLVSIEHEEPARLLGLEIPDLWIRWAERHPHKLRVGHLRGNRFTIRIRHASERDLPRVRRILERLERAGLPNYFGPQRFGVGGSGVGLGRALVRRDWKGFLDLFLGRDERGDPPMLRTARAKYREGDLSGAAECVPRRHGDVLRALRALAGGADPAGATAAVARRMRQLFVSSFQSHLFNRVVSARLSALGQLWDGDVAYLHRNGASFVVEDASAEQRRAEAFEISPSGPIVGWRLLQGSGRPRAIEDAVFAEEGVSPEEFRDLGVGLNQKGIRRPLRVPLRETRAEWWEGCTVLTFFLPKGCYATTLLEEVLKKGAAADPSAAAAAPPRVTDAPRES
ncbi:MAG TPA: tRNA pseudouridine(13) synthase TruD [Planctomycetota bacterium]|jgi:tRNA pseudouridine13 synthase|nr:tRNA pseudouridine(13) synthase TruD [Planctomycetota bacterium]